MSRFRIVAVLVSLAVVALAGHPAWMENLNNIENTNRVKHNVLPLVIEDGLSSMAQKWSDKLAEECKSLSPDSHAPGEKRIYKDLIAAGENIHAAILQDATRAKAQAESVAPGAGNNWYSEIKYYPWPEYTNQTFPPKVQIGHFTQQVWKGSKVVGYGLGVHPKCHRVFVVARYWPLGNIQGTYKDNVLKPQ